jgi:hypothetical protein
MKMNIFNRTRLTAKTLDEVHDGYIRDLEEFTGINVTITDIKEAYFKRIHNSWDCPIGGVVNWCGKDKNLPDYYYGFYNSISGNWEKKLPKIIKYKNKEYKLSFSLDIFSMFEGFHTGTFNGGQCFSGEIRFYIDDFPLLKKNLINVVSFSELAKAYEIDEKILKRKLILEENI